MPSAIAISMYCVNLLDMLTPVSSGNRRTRVWQIPQPTQHASRIDGFATMFRLWKARVPTSVQCSAQSVQLNAPCAIDCIEEVKPISDLINDLIIKCIWDARRA